MLVSGKECLGCFASKIDMGSILLASSVLGCFPRAGTVCERSDVLGLVLNDHRWQVSRTPSFEAAEPLPCGTVS